MTDAKRLAEKILIQCIRIDDPHRDKYRAVIESLLREAMEVKHRQECNVEWNLSYERGKTEAYTRAEEVVWNPYIWETSDELRAKIAAAIEKLKNEGKS